MRYFKSWNESAATAEGETRVWSLHEAIWQLRVLWETPGGRSSSGDASLTLGWAGRRAGVLRVRWQTPCLGSSANGELHFEDFSFCHCEACLSCWALRHPGISCQHRDRLSWGSRHRGQFCQGG